MGISFSGAPLTLIRIVFPMPSFNKVPNARLDLMALVIVVPASVTPKCSG